MLVTSIFFFPYNVFNSFADNPIKENIMPFSRTNALNMNDFKFSDKKGDKEIHRLRYFIINQGFESGGVAFAKEANATN